MRTSTTVLVKYMPDCFHRSLWSGIVLTLWIFMGTGPLFSQATGGHEDVIYLINKGRYRGEILDWGQEDRVRIRTWSGLVVDVPVDMIKRVVQRRVPGIDPRFSQGRFYKAVSMGPGGAESGFGWMFDGQFGYQFNRWALVGLSSGLHILDNYEDLLCVPLMVEWRAFPFASRLSPYIALRTGLCFPWSENKWITDRDFLTSYSGNALAGLQLGQLGEAAFLLEAGYQFNRIHSERSWVDSKGNPIVHHRSELIQRMLLRIGVIF